MAKRKHHKTKTHSRRRRSGLGAVNTSSMLTKIAGVAVGAIGGRMLNNALGAKVDPKIAAAGTIAVGAIAPAKFAKGSAFMQGVGDGLVAVGVTNLLASTGVIKGIDEMTDGMSGVGDLSEIAGLPEIAGYEDSNIEP